MPRERRVERLLPPAVITECLLRRIAGRIPDSLQNRATWFVGFGSNSVTEPNLDALFAEIRDEVRFDELSLEVLDDESASHTFTLWCQMDSIGISYNVSTEKESSFLRLAEDIEGLFDQSKRLRARIPQPLRVWGSLRGPTFLIGSASAPMLSKLNMTRVMEDILSRVVAHILTLALGWLLGVLTSDYIKALFTLLGSIK